MPNNKHSHSEDQPVYDWRYLSLLLTTLLLGILAYYFSPITQSRYFYHYADQRSFFGIPHFWNIFSNFGFLLVGYVGLKALRCNSLTIIPQLSSIYHLFFVSLITAFIGSSIYHYSPTPFTLMLDRIPITIGFCSLYCIVLAEHVSLKLAKTMIIPILAYGIISVLYWYMTDVLTGRGDMAAYILVQLLPIIHIPMIIALYPSKLGNARYYLMAIGMYGLAKLAESNDEEIYNILGGISGHSLKHVLAAIGAFLIYLGWKRR
ncbi:ceramidase domain-containing protein [Photobacterium nomapromontoriensis]|uniref:ceramidase domain-containing protein n=1 Tax=Photobacterium nomapromontoriensis TaxID=2910237 RepID=UPI003D0F9B31